MQPAGLARGFLACGHQWHGLTQRRSRKRRKFASSHPLERFRGSLGFQLVRELIQLVEINARR